MVFRNEDAHLIRSESHEIGTPKSAFLYRCFPEKEYANDFVKGRIYISTFEACRRYENDWQGDPGEGTLTHVVDQLRGNSGDQKFERVASSLGIEIGPGCTGVRVSGSVGHRIENAYVLCLTENPPTEEMREKFGRFCVRINSPLPFFNAVSAEMSKVCKTEQSHFGVVTYSDREVRDLDAPPAPEPFIKPPAYAYQNEVRIVLYREMVSAIEPLTIICPEVKRQGMCKRIY